MASVLDTTAFLQFLLLLITVQTPSGHPCRKQQTFCMSIESTCQAAQEQQDTLFVKHMILHQLMLQIVFHLWHISHVPSTGILAGSQSSRQID
jgi:hypothetical protein